MYLRSCSAEGKVGQRQTDKEAEDIKKKQAKGTSATPRGSQAVTSRGRCGYSYVALEGEVDPDQKGARRPPGGVAVFLTCGADLVGVRDRKLCARGGAGGGCRTSGWPDWAGPG